MKIAVSATSGSLDAQIDPRFGRCPYFVIVDSETMGFEALPNTSQWRGRPLDQIRKKIKELGN